MKTLWVLIFGSAYALSATGPVREVTSQAARTPNQVIPGFHKGYLFYFDHANVRVYSPEGFAAFVVVLEVPNGSNPSAMGLAADTDGSIAISVID